MATSNANNWLNELKARSGGNGNKVAILYELETGNPFLPLERDGERRALIAELQRVAEQDKVHQFIEQFRRIGKRKTIEQAIEALNTLLNEISD